jgi:hypothetical protein
VPASGLSLLLKANIPHVSPLVCGMISAQSVFKGFEGHEKLSKYFWQDLIPELK